MKKKAHLFIIILIIIPLIFLINIKGWDVFLRNISNDLSAPLMETAYFFFFNISEGVARLKSYPELIRINTALKEQLINLKHENLLLTEKELQNQRLRKLLSIKDELKYDCIGASVIGYDISADSKWIILNVGADKGIKKGMPVIMKEGVVGKIVYVGMLTSRVILLNDKNSRISALIQSSRDIGIVEGNGSEYLNMRYIDLNADISIGDIVISSGMGEIFPKGLPIGVVTEIAKERNGLFLTVTVKPYVVFKKIEDVLCLKNIK